MTTRLRLAKDFTFPLELVTESVAILARKRAGKSNTAKVLVEQLFRAKQQVVVVDPKGDWWGLRFSRDGKGPGLPVIILGGHHADVPLEAGSGQLVARLVVHEAASIVLDLSKFSKSERHVFMTAFLETLYRLKAEDDYRTPMMLAIDEADQIAPQRPQKGEERMLGAADDIVRLGGQRGIGVILVSQRSAVLNKNVLTQVSILITLQTTGSQDIDALNTWIEKHGHAEEGEELVAALPSLPRGTAWVWAPGWPDERGIFRQVAVNLCETFDSGATPKPGERRVVPKTAADVDLEAFRREMAATIEKAKAEDPKELQRQVRELKAEVARVSRAAPASAGKRVEVKVAVLNEPLVRRLEAAVKRLPAIEARYEKSAEVLVAGRGRVVEAVQALERRLVEARAPAGTDPKLDRATPSSYPTVRAIRSSDAVAPPRPTFAHAEPGDPDVGGGGLRRILIALAQRPQGLTLRQIGVRAGLSSRSGTFSTYMSRGRQRGWIRDGGPGGASAITDAGLRALGTYEPLPSGSALLQYWLRELGESGAARILRASTDAYPESMPLDEVGKRAGLNPRSGTFSTYLSRLRTLELIEGRGQITASSELFS